MRNKRAAIDQSRAAFKLRAVLASCAACALILQGGAAFAEGIPAQPAPADRPVASSPGRVGSLSPDEQRRAARGRARAAASEQAARDKAAARGAGVAAPANPASGTAATAPTAPATTTQAAVAAPVVVAPVVAAPAVAPSGAAVPRAVAENAANPALATHRSAAVVGPVRAEPAAAPPAEAHARRVARVHRAHRSRYASTERGLQPGDRVPDDAVLMPLQPGLFRAAPPRPYERMAGDAPGIGPWGARPAYPPPYLVFRQGW